jgi:20S proteasome alpha/beta subunit
MSLGIVIKGPEGLVLAAESRLTLQGQVGPQSVSVYFDTATKLMNFSAPNTTVGVVTYGQAVIGLQTPRTAASFMSEFEASLPGERLPIEAFATKISEFFLKQWQSSMPGNYQGQSMTFVVAGFDEKDIYGRVYTIDIPSAPQPKQVNPDSSFGITLGGQSETVNRILSGYAAGLPDALTKDLKLDADQVAVMRQTLAKFQSAIPMPILGLQDCVNMAIFLIRATIGVQGFTVDIRGVGGPIDIAIITRNKDLHFIQQKQVSGES